MRHRRLAEEADARFPVRVRLAQPRGGLGQRFSEIQMWLDANCGADGWTIAPASIRGTAQDALGIYFLDAALATAFVARWCVAQRAEMTGGVFKVRDDAPAPRTAATAPKSPL